MNNHAWDDHPSKATREFLHRLEEVTAIAQNGLTFAKDPFDLERYKRLRNISSEMLALTSGKPAPLVHDWLSLDRHYATPKMDVRGLVMRKENILMVRERSDGLWSLPGGWCDVNRSPRETVESEVQEETGLVVHGSRLLALFDKHKHAHPPQIPHAYKCFFLCSEVGGELVSSSIETEEAAFVPWTKLPPLSLHRVTQHQLQTIVAIAKDPGCPPAFD